MNKNEGEVTPNYDLHFSSGNFYINKIYDYRKDEEAGLFFITTEEGNEQDLLFSEFDLYFTVI